MLAFQHCTFENCRGKDAALVNLCDISDETELKVRFIDCTFNGCRRRSDTAPYDTFRQSYVSNKFNDCSRDDLVWESVA